MKGWHLFASASLRATLQDHWPDWRFSPVFTEVSLFVQCLAPNLLQRLGDQKGQFQGLVGVHARVAVGVVTIR